MSEKTHWSSARASDQGVNLFVEGYLGVVDCGSDGGRGVRVRDLDV